MSDNPAYALSFDNVSVSRGDNTLFDGLSFSVSPGEVVWIQGTNGSGKTTILNMANGFYKPRAGVISWQLNQTEASPADLVCYQGHADALKPDLHVFEDLEFWQDVYNARTDVEDILRLIGLQDKSHLYCRQLSAGQRRRLVIGRLLLSQKPIWVLDEPTASLDTSGRQQIYDFIAAHAQNGGAVILATHQEPVKLATRTRVISLESAS